MNMARRQATAKANLRLAAPEVRPITTADLREALARGLDDFGAMPSHVVFLSLIYPAAGLIFGQLAFGYQVLPILFPLVAGFALVGPLAAIGLYELSRRREHGLEASWKQAFGVLRSTSLPAIVTLGSLLMAIFIAWLIAAQVIYNATFGDVRHASLAAFASDIFTTRAGWTLIVVGNAVGLLFAVIAFTISVVSFPLLLDRDVGFAAAVATSARVVLANPAAMALWGFIVATALVLGSIPLLIGLAVVMPILGHSTWHLYRKAVDPGTAPRASYRPWPKGKRYAADFPAALFPWSRDKPR
jgi:uncharacterized membrane protein